MRLRPALHRAVLAAVVFASPVLAVRAQGAPLPSGPAGDLVREGRKLASQGKHVEAVASYAKALAINPAMYEANASNGVALDLLGRYAEARASLAKAIDAATPAQKTGALRSMAFSYAFERNCDGAVRYAKQAFDIEMARVDYNAAAEVANELARLCIESEKLDVAQAWYKTGYETALKQPVLPDSAKDLWGFRFHNALARLAARKGDKAQAAMHVGHAKAFLDKGTNPGQLSFLPYLTGYVAFFTGDMPTAIADLKQAQQNDPFVLSLMAQAYEKTGDSAAAMELWKKILTINNHNPTNAFARPEARKRLF